MPSTLLISVLRLNTRKIIRGRGGADREGKTTTFQMVTESRHSAQVPIQAPTSTILEDDWPSRWEPLDPGDYSKFPSAI